MLVLFVKNRVIAKKFPLKIKNQPKLANVEKKKEAKIQKKVWKPKAMPKKVIEDKDILENMDSSK